MKAIGLAVLILFLLEMIPAQSALAAQGGGAKEILTDGFYGGLAGALVGAAAMAFTKHPSDHTRDIAIGAGVGVILGTLYGVGKVTRAIAEIDDGNLTVQMPTLQFNMAQDGKRLQPLLSVDLLRVPF